MLVIPQGCLRTANEVVVCMAVHLEPRQLWCSVRL
jgi:hypothetical protein